VLCTVTVSGIAADPDLDPTLQKINNNNFLMKKSNVKIKILDSLALTFPFIYTGKFHRQLLSKIVLL
jgi:hypothetical protein